MIFLAALALAAAERTYQVGMAMKTEPGMGAQWIWAPGATEQGEPIAFFAVRDFLLDGKVRAWAQLTVDESYGLWINGHRLGSGVYQEGEPAELYELSDYLKPGWNRLMIEASSSRGAGGILASLRVGDSSAVELVTDAEWRIFEDAPVWLVTGTRALGDDYGSRPEVWQLPPTGRWRPPTEVIPASPLADRDAVVFPQRLRHPAAPATPEVWRQLKPGERLPHLESQVVFEFPHEVVGHLEMGVGLDAEPALLIFDLDEPLPPDGRDADGVLMAVPILGEWHDPQARRFRYVTIVGTAPVDWLRVRTAALADPPIVRTRGVFGLDAPSPLRRVEEAVWRRLQD